MSDVTALTAPEGESAPANSAPRINSPNKN